jgi:hypothetical protein
MTSPSVITTAELQLSLGGGKLIGSEGKSTSGLSISSVSSSGVVSGVSVVVGHPTINMHASTQENIETNLLIFLQPIVTPPIFTVTYHFKSSIFSLYEQNASF